MYFFSALIINLLLTYKLLAQTGEGCLLEITVLNKDSMCEMVFFLLQQHLEALSEIIFPLLDTV